MAIKRKYDQTFPESFTIQPTAAATSDAAAPCAVYFANALNPAGELALSWSLQRNPAGQNMVIANTVAQIATAGCSVPVQSQETFPSQRLC